MERLKTRLSDTEKALNTLNEILSEKYSVIVRDASIQRFEYTFEALWKFVKEYLNDVEGIISNSPKSCFRELFALGLISEEDTIGSLEMTDSRNNTSHTYKEEVSQIIYGKLKVYSILIGKIIASCSKKIQL